MILCEGKKMWKCVFLSFVKLGITFVLLLILYVILSNQILKKTDANKCPFCYGENLCDAFVNVSLKKTLFAVILNLFNTKNVFYANFNNSEVILKKLASNEELQELDKQICIQHRASDNCNLSELPDVLDYKKKLWEYLNNREIFKSFKLCSENSAKILMNFFLKLKTDDIKENYFLKNLWTIVQINVEPLILQLLNFDMNWPVPKYYGSCGRFIMEEYCGTPLTYMTNLNWTDRAWLALQLLHMAENFTSSHPYFRFYLTDLSSDNIVVDDKLKLTFVDLENILVTHKNRSTAGIFHQSEILPEEGFAYSEESICNSAISDHNYFAVCKLLLSKTAKWPMMENGLLHNPPEWIVDEHSELFELIEKCALTSERTNRITASKTIINILNNILMKTKTKYQNRENKIKIAQKVDL